MHSKTKNLNKKVWTLFWNLFYIYLPFLIIKLKEKLAYQLNKILTKILYAIKINYSNKKKKVKIYRKKYDVED